MAVPSSKEAQAYLIDVPEPAAETGLNSHFGNTMAAKPAASTTRSTSSPRGSLSSNNPFRDPFAAPAPTKAGARATERPASNERERFPSHREEAFSALNTGPRRSGDFGSGGSGSGSNAANTGPSRRRGSSLRERFPGDESHKPLDIVRRESKKASRSPHLTKRHLPGADTIDRLDPALGGRAYHHEGPYDAASLARNTGRNAPIAALVGSNQEALKATPRENIRDAVERHKPLDGVADVPPGEADQFGRTYQYEEGTDMMREGTSGDAGYKRWPGKQYDPEDLKGQSEPTFSLDRALRAHKIDDDGIEMEDREHINKDFRKAERKGTLDARDPVQIAGSDAKYADMEYANNAHAREYEEGLRGHGSLKEGLKRRIGSLRHRKNDD
ncbi:hypothetical protein LTR36_003334 [Oleoguttula mirabilis]|uniref:Uncharacterized protein n=1 Tax=Oleoguttula mirabilis TaxID=1507867 RepID=A0AAV9JX94_9PEZI|nr:hypothetical protein LTR36_003334 [Oleoguttula mirabilis]